MIYDLKDQRVIALKLSQRLDQLLKKVWVGVLCGEGHRYTRCETVDRTRNYVLVFLQKLDYPKRIREYGGKRAGMRGGGMQNNNL